MQLNRRLRRCSNHNSQVTYYSHLCTRSSPARHESLQEDLCRDREMWIMPFAASVEQRVKPQYLGFLFPRRYELRIFQLLVLSDSSTAFCMEPNDENTIEITKTADLLHVHDEQIDVRLDGHRANQFITICHEQPKSRTQNANPVAYCFHDWCHEILIQKLGRSCTEIEIYKLCRILSLDSVAWESGYYQIDPTSCQTLCNLADVHPPLSKLLRLPKELRHIIWEYTGLQAAFCATVLVAEETARLVRALDCSSCRTVSLTQGSHISVKMFTVFGTSYIQSLANEEGSKVIPGVVVYLKFAMVYGGICAIKLYGNDWDTGWLGVLPSTGHIWYGSIQRLGNTLTCSYNVS